MAVGTNKLDISVVDPIDLGDGRQAAGAAYDYLREKILDGTIPPESVISQVALADRLGVSRTPLREALRRLQQEGLIDAEHNRRARVVSIDPNDLEHVYTNRILFETLGIALTVPELEPEELATIEQALTDMRAHVTTGNHAAWEEAHARFHHSLLVHTPEQLARTIATFAARGDRYRRFYQSRVPRAWTIGDAEHEAILRACEARDPSLAATLLARHYGRTAISLIATITPEREPVQLRTALRLVTGHNSRIAPETPV
jgi:DNA-binding GntR family transcriptional regulator